MMRHKKAVVEVQFNWIFILIAGALILFLFSSIILKQKSTSESTSQITMLKHVTSIAIGSEATSGITNTVDLSEATLSFDCNTIRVGQKSQPISQMVLFSPTVVRTPLIVHTREWSLPFRVTNVVYLSSPRIRYVLIGDTDLAKYINKSISDKFSKNYYKTFSEFDSIPLQKDDHIRVIIFNGATPEQVNGKLGSKTSKEASLLLVDSAAEKESGQVSFYTKTTTGWDTPISREYLKEEMLIGAIFTDSAKQYDCITDNMKKKLGIVAQVYDGRRGAIYGQTNPAISPLPTYARCHGEYGDTFGSSGESLHILTTPLAFLDYKAPAANLAAINKRLERQSCPLLY